MLTVVSEAKTDKKWVAYWNCKCDCGKYTVVRANNLKSGKVKSCGCKSQRKSKFKEVNELTSSERHVLKSRWNGMIERCYGKNEYCKYYKKKGVSVCEEWKNSFDNFALWSIKNGFSTSLTIDRIDYNGDYCPDNCRWVSWKIQGNNRSSNVFFEYNGEKLTLSQISEKYGINHHTLFSRIYYQKLSINEAIERPVKKHTSHKEELKITGLSEKCKNHNISYQTVWNRIYLYGWSEEKALTTPVRRNK